MDITLCQHLTDTIQQRSESRDDQNRCHEAQPMIPQVQNHCIDHRSQHDDSLRNGRSPLTGNMTILPRSRNHGRNQQGQEKQGPDQKRPASRHVSGRHRPGQPRSLITSFHAYSPFASFCGKPPASFEPQQSQKDAKSQQIRPGHWPPRADFHSCELLWSLRLTPWLSSVGAPHLWNGDFAAWILEGVLPPNL